MVDIMLSMGHDVFVLFTTRHYKKIDYPPLYDIVVDMMFDYLQKCIQDHADRVSSFSTGLLGFYQFMDVIVTFLFSGGLLLLDLQLEKWIEKELLKTPTLHLVPINRKQEQQMVVEDQLRSCADPNCYEEIQTRYVSTGFQHD